MRTYLVLALYFIFLHQVFSQTITDFSVSSIDSILKVDVHSVVRLNRTEVIIESASKMNVKKHLIVTIFNKKGENPSWFSESYSPTHKIKHIEAKIYNSSGVEVNKITKGNFIDRTATDYSTIASEDRYKYLYYDTKKYPYTIDYMSEIETSSTGFLPSFYFIRTYNQSLEIAEYEINNQTEIPIRYKTSNLKNFDVTKVEESNLKLSYKAKNLRALKSEKYSPFFTEIFPYIKATLEDFTLIDVSGKVTDWKTMGIWQNENLLKGRNTLSELTINEVNDLVKGETDAIAKAKLIYNYVQNKTRYVSIQLGIGGWKPMKAEDVENFGYGDCKGLTNYTKALLDSQNIPAYYSVIYGGSKIKNIDEDFASIQGNHVILNLPNDGDDIWLECTSQTTPFGYIGGFTDNRNALVITPNGGVIKRTTHYPTDTNVLITEVNIKFNSDNSISGTLKSNAEGIQYNWNRRIKYAKDKNKYYKEKKFAHINNLKIESINLNDNKEEVNYTEEFNFAINSFGNKAGSRLIFKPNFFNVYRPKLNSDKERRFDIIIPRGFIYEDHYTYEFPENHEIYKIPKAVKLESDFGLYSYSIEKISAQKIKVFRKLKINEGKFSKDRTKEYSVFLKKINDTDNSKAILNKI